MCATLRAPQDIYVFYSTLVPCRVFLDNIEIFCKLRRATTGNPKYKFYFADLFISLYPPQVVDYNVCNFFPTYTLC